MCPNLPPILSIIPARRRSDRVSLAFHVEITGMDEAGEAFTEKTCTTAVSRYGCGIKLPRAVRFNEELRIRRLDSGDWEIGRVVAARTNAHPMNGLSEQAFYGVEIVKPCDEFWGIRFSSSDERLREALRDGMYFVDRERKITHWSEGAEIVSGHAAADTVGKYCYNNVLGHTDGKGTSLCTKGCPLASTMLDGKPREFEMYMLHKEGHYVAVTVRAQAILNSAGRIVGAVEMFHQHLADGPEAASVRVPLGGPPPGRLALIQIAERPSQRPTIPIFRWAPNPQVRRRPRVRDQTSSACSAGHHG
jgi:hypothetical protein